jgi:hypothetical protein
MGSAGFPAGGILADPAVNIGPGIGRVFELVERVRSGLEKDLAGWRVG